MIIVPALVDRGVFAIFVGEEDEVFVVDMLALDEEIELAVAVEVDADRWRCACAGSTSIER